MVAAGPSRISVITVGDELLSGETRDTNLSYIAGVVGEMGMELCHHRTVPDSEPEIARALGELAGECEAVIITGGLGPTGDDVTREGVALAAGVELESRREIALKIEGFFRSLGREMAPENLRQARLPAGSVEIPPAGGTAPGFMMELRGSLVFALPGVPAEMRHMMDTFVRERLQESSAADGFRLSRRILTFGLGESDLAGRLSDLAGRSGVDYGFLVQGGPIVVKLTARARSRREAEALLDEEQASVERRLGWLVYGHGDEEMEDVVGRLLTDRRLTISTAESVTAGMVASRLVNVPGSSKYFLGGCVAYGCEAKAEILGVGRSLLSEGAVSKEVAERMAEGANELFGSDLAVATTGVAGPSAGSEKKRVGTVCIGLASGRGTVSLERVLPGNRKMVRNLTALAALDVVRLHLAGTSPEEVFD